MTSANLLHAHGLALDAPRGRPLFRDLTLILNRGELPILQRYQRFDRITSGMSRGVER
jgi:hypothetical protein